MFDKVIRPVNSYVVIKKENESKTDSGIVLTAAVDNYNQGIVASVDSANFLGLQVGSRVLFDQTNAPSTAVNGEKLYFATENQIFGILNV